MYFSSGNTKWKVMGTVLESPITERESPMRNDRTIPMNKEMVEIIKEQLDAFREKFGREAGPEDPIFFNPDCDTPTPLTAEYMDHMMTEALHRAGIDLQVLRGESV